MKLSIKTYMVLYLAVLLVLSAVMLNQLMRIFVGVAIVALYAAADLLWTYFKSRATPTLSPSTGGGEKEGVDWQYIPSSSIISALIIALVFDTLNHAWLALLAVVLAVVNKHLLHFGRIRHLMNPAAVSLVVISFFVPVVSWWGAAWGTLPLVIIIGSGVYIVSRLRRFAMAGTFLFVYAILLLIVFLFRGGSPPPPFLLLFASVVDGTLLFFTTVMLIEPITTSYPRSHDRVWFGALVGALAVVFMFVPFRAMDPLLLALVVGTMVVGMRTVPRVRK